MSGLVDRCQRLAMAAACLARARAYLGDALYWFAINGDAAEAAALCRNALDGARFGAGYVQWVKADREREESADDAARGEAGKEEEE